VGVICGCTAAVVDLHFLTGLSSNVPISDELVIGPGKWSSHLLILVDRSEQQGEV